MALYVKQDQNRSQLQEKLAAELQEKARRKAEHENPDGVEDSNYIKDTKKTTSLAWLWVLIVVLGIGLLIWLIVSNL